MNRIVWLEHFKNKRYAIYNYKVNLGHSYFQTALKFKISQGRVVQIVKKVKDETAK